ncbi:MAG TPA: hypothetical protein V6C52_03345 [Coleofasciculaceae cyanobacterium]
MQSRTARTLDQEDRWLIGKRRYLGYADEVGEVFTNIEAFKERIAKFLGKFMKEDKAREVAFKRYNIPLLGNGHSLTAALGYGIAYVYCGLNMVSRAFQGWRKAKEGGNSTSQSTLKVATDLTGLGIFHYFATMKLAPKFLNWASNRMDKLALTDEALSALKTATEAQQPRILHKGMFKANAVKLLTKIPGLTAERLPKVFPWLQVALALGLIPLISHPFDKAVQTILDFTYRPLVGLNKFEKADNVIGFRSVPNAEFWGTPPAPPALPSMPLDHTHQMKIHEKPDTFEVMFGSSQRK